MLNSIKDAVGMGGKSKALIEAEEKIAALVLERDTIKQEMEIQAMQHTQEREKWAASEAMQDAEIASLSENFTKALQADRSKLEGHILKLKDKVKNQATEITALQKKNREHVLSMKGGQPPTLPTRRFKAKTRVGRVGKGWQICKRHAGRDTPDALFPAALANLFRWLSTWAHVAGNPPLSCSQM